MDKNIKGKNVVDSKGCTAPLHWHLSEKHNQKPISDYRLYLEAVN